MPIFEYRCPEGHSFERFVSHAEASNTYQLPCEKCDKFAERIISASNFHLKGTWFKTKGTY